MPMCRGFRTIEQKKLTEFRYAKESPFFKSRKALFITKQIAAIFAMLWLILIFLRKYWS